MYASYIPKGPADYLLDDRFVPPPCRLPSGTVIAAELSFQDDERTRSATTSWTCSSLRCTTWCRWTGKPRAASTRVTSKDLVCFHMKQEVFKMVRVKAQDKPDTRSAMENGADEVACLFSHAPLF